MISKNKYILILIVLAIGIAAFLLGLGNEHSNSFTADAPLPAPQRDPGSVSTKISEPTTQVQREKTKLLFGQIELLRKFPISREEFYKGFATYITNDGLKNMRFEWLNPDDTASLQLRASIQDIPVEMAYLSFEKDKGGSFKWSQGNIGIQPNEKEFPHVSLDLGVKNIEALVQKYGYVLKSLSFKEKKWCVEGGNSLIPCLDYFIRFTDKEKIYRVETWTLNATDLSVRDKRSHVRN